jgi:hypothetical protein
VTTNTAPETEATPDDAQVKDLVVLLDLTQTEKDLRDAEERHKGIVHDVKSPKGMKAAKADVAELRGMRTTVDKKRLEAGRVLLGMKKVNDDQAKGLMERISALEEPIKAQIEAEEARKEAERLEAIEREQARVDGHRARIAAWRNLPGDLLGRPIAGIEIALKRLLAEEPSNWDDFEEFKPEAWDAYGATVARVKDILRDAKEREAEAERVRQQEAELAAMKERMAQMEREAEERRKEDEARNEREAQAERDRVEAAERAERERIEAIEREACAREEAAQRARDAEVAAERQRQLEEAQRVADEERAKAREAAQKAEEERQSNLTLRTAAQALVRHCVSAGMGHDKPVEDMAAVLMNTEGDVPQRKRAAAKPAKVAR